MQINSSFKYNFQQDKSEKRQAIQTVCVSAYVDRKLLSGRMYRKMCHEFRDEMELIAP